MFDKSTSESEKMDIRWDSNMPEYFSVHKWRKKQLQKYLQINPEAKGTQIKSWIQSHNPDPWPEVQLRNLNKTVQSL